MKTKLSEFKSYYRSPIRPKKFIPSDIIGVSKGSLKIVKDFSTPGIKIWAYVLSNLQTGMNEVEIKIDKITEWTEYKGKSNVYKGIIELLNKEFLFRSTEDKKYFVNLNYIRK